jgi:sec-independent protein translocase protein TatA
MPFGIGIWELLVLLAVMLLVFGPKKLPEMGRSLGRGVRELREGITSPPDVPEASGAERELTR